MFLMILTLNLQNYPEFMKTIFKSQINFFHNLVDLLETLKKKNQFLLIINHLFLEEYKQIFFNYNKPDIELEELFIDEQGYFGDIYSEPPIHYEKQTYLKLFSHLLKFDLSYNNFFAYHNNEIDIEEKPAYKLNIAQSLIRAIFSKEKNQYTNEKYYEFNLIKKIIDKDMEETIEKYGDQYKTLFRKEDICDDFLKYMFFVFGNTMIIESFINPLKKLLQGVEVDRNINKEEFNNLVTEFITKLKKTIPDVLKILLKLLYESVKKHFTIEKDNYGPLYTTLIFNFIINPKIQYIYNVNSSNNKFIRTLNRLLRNACFNFKFNEEDQLSIYNDIIEKNYLKIKNFMKENIIGINIEDNKVKSSLGDIFSDKFVICPKFSFYLDSNILFECNQKKASDMINYEDLNTDKKK